MLSCRVLIPELPGKKRSKKKKKHSKKQNFPSPLLLLLLFDAQEGGNGLLQLGDLLLEAGHAFLELLDLLVLIIFISLSAQSFLIAEGTRRVLTAVRAAGAGAGASSSSLTAGYATISTFDHHDRFVVLTREASAAALICVSLI